LRGPVCRCAGHRFCAICLKCEQHCQCPKGRFMNKFGMARRTHRAMMASSGAMSA